MSMTTSYRYELNTKRAGLSKALQRQHDKIQRDEMMADRDNQAKLEKEINLKAAWNESLEIVSQNKRVKENIQKINGELVLAGKAVNAVRRAALRKLLEREDEEYKQELHQKGHTFYVQRL